jgi:hypothetical protein
MGPNWRAFPQTFGSDQETVTMTIAKFLVLMVACLPPAIAVLSSVSSAEAAEGCDACGCRRIKKITRLVKTIKEVEVPVYKNVQIETYHPDKGAVCHAGYRCDTYLKPHVHWHAKECRVNEESCEHVQHCVNKGHGCCSCECSEETHHKEHVDYKVQWTRGECVCTEVDAGCKTLYGTNTCGCRKSTCVKEPTSETCVRRVPELHWVTMNVCRQCNHNWSSAHELGGSQEGEIESLPDDANREVRRSTPRVSAILSLRPRQK